MMMTGPRLVTLLHCLAADSTTDHDITTTASHATAADHDITATASHATAAAEPEH